MPGQILTGGFRRCVAVGTGCVAVAMTVATAATAAPPAAAADIFSALGRARSAFGVLGLRFIAVFDGGKRVVVTFVSGRMFADRLTLLRDGFARRGATA
jgi:hypothetical protein